MITFVAGGFSSSSDSLARRLEKSLKINLKDSTSPVLIEDMADKNSYYVIMPMKI